jgi:ribosomal protein S18 acetylase RimI-like enzyme
MPEVEYRQATEKDAGGIAAVGAAVWDELGAKSGLPQRPTKDGLSALMSSFGERGAMFVCDNAGEVSGFAAVSPDQDDPGGAVMGVWLLRAARRKGIGRELALMATEFARSAGYQRLRGTLPEANEPALSFFSDIGSLAQVVGQGMEYELPL